MRRLENENAEALKEVWGPLHRRIAIDESNCQDCKPRRASPDSRKCLLKKTCSFPGLTSSWCFFIQRAAPAGRLVGETSRREWSPISFTTPRPAREPPGCSGDLVRCLNFLSAAPSIKGFGRFTPPPPPTTTRPIYIVCIFRLLVISLPPSACITKPHPLSPTLTIATRPST